MAMSQSMAAKTVAASRAAATLAKSGPPNGMLTTAMSRTGIAAHRHMMSKARQALGSIHMPQLIAQPADPFDTALAELQGMLVDIDGDGQPDAVVPQGGNAMAQAGQIPNKMIPQGSRPIAPGFEMMPQQGNAMAAAGGQQYGQPTVQMPVGQHGETRTQSAVVGQPAPETDRNAMLRAARGVGDWAGGIVNDVASDPLGAVSGLDAYGGLTAPLNTARMFGNPGTREMMTREARSATESGMRKNLSKDIDMGVWRRQEADAAFNARPEVELSRRPHWEVQGKDANGHWQKLSPEAKEARDRGIELRRREQAAIDRAKKYNEGAN